MDYQKNAPAPWAPFLGMAACGLFLACLQDPEPKIPGLVTQDLAWTSAYTCRDGNLYGVYQGTLRIHGLEAGEKANVYYGDSLAWEIVAGSAGSERFDFEYSGIDLQRITIHYRGDTLHLSSQDSMYVSAPAAYIPFPVRFHLRASKRSGGITTSADKVMSLLASDTGYSRIRCRPQTGAGLYDIVRDTLKFRASNIHLALLADSYGNYYKVTATYLDSTGETMTLFNHDAAYGYDVDSKNTLRRSDLDFGADVPSLPALVTLSLGIGVYQILIQEE